MRFLQKVFDFYIDSSIHVAIACTALVYLTFIQVKIEVSYIFLWFSLSLTITGYNFVKYVPVFLQQKNFYQSLQFKQLSYFSIFTGLVSILLFFQLDFDKYYILFPFLLLTFLYIFPLSGSYKNLRTIPGIKIIIVALVWTGITYIVPVFYMDIFTGTMLIEIIKRLILILILMIPFEIRDLDKDRQYLYTLPQVVGIFSSKKIGYLLIFVFISLGYLQYVKENQIFLPDLFISIVLILVLWYTRKKQSLYFSSFWVESIPLLYVLFWKTTFFIKISYM